MENSQKKPFIPKDKPKSFVILLLATLVALFVATPIAFLGHYIESELVFRFGYVLFFLSWLVWVVMLLINRSKSIMGKYKDITEKEWGEQEW